MSAVYAQKSSLEFVKSRTENIQKVMEKVSEENVLKVAQAIADTIEFTGKLSIEKLAAINKYKDKILNHKLFKSTTKLAKVAGPIGDAVILALSLFSQEAEEKFEEYFKNILEKFDVVETKLDEVSEKVEW